jgi:PAS domain S-box-containing protein
MFGYPAGEVIGQNLAILWPSSPEGVREVCRPSGPAVAGPAPVGAVREVEARRRDGTTFPAEVVVSEMRLEDQRFFHAIIRDIGERKRAEESLRQQRDFAESLIETAQAIVLVLDREGRVVRFNPYLEEMAGYLLEEVQGQDWLRTFVAEGNRSCMRDLLSEALAGARIRGRVCPIITRAEGGREVGWSATTLRDGRGEAVGVLLVGYDFTELKQAQEQALQAGRLAAIGQMVAGLAHESRNALQRSQAGLERLQLRLKGQPEVCALLDEVQEAQDRLHRLYEEVRVYAGPIKLERRVCHLADVWREAWAYLGALRKGRRAVLHEEAADLGRDFVADPYRLEQVFANILSNCLAACSDPVRIEIRCEEAELEGRPALRVAVCDNGPGLNREQREKIFEPFYTTKTKGTGLGMAIARRIVEAHGGRIDIGGEGCPGTEILITLPRRER